MQGPYNLKAALSHFKISNLELAKAVGIDPSLISRYLTGRRQLKSASWQAEAIAEYLLGKADTIENIEWLNAQFEEARISTEASSVLQIKKNLIAWISSDGDSLLETEQEMEEEPAGETRSEDENRMLSGLLSISAELNTLLYSVPTEGTIDLFLTSDRIKTFVSPGFSSTLREVIRVRKMNMNVVVCVSGSTQSLNKVINCYLRDIVAGTMRLYTFFGATQNVAEQMYLIIPQKSVLMITEPPIGSAEPVGAMIRNPDFIEELCQSFNATYRYSQPMLNVFHDSYTRNMIEIIYTEYCMPGSLDVVKDSINPMYMSYEDYCRVLRAANTDDGEYAWKCSEFRRFRDGFDQMLDTGMENREIISLKRLKTIVREGQCRMAGLYFLNVGFFNLDAEGCRDILRGYIHYLEHYPNFSLLILDDLPELHNCNCWHVKSGQGVAINDWTGTEPVMLHSTHSTLVQEFQDHYNAVWERGTGSLRNRAYMISILRGIIKQIEETLAPLPENN